MNILVKEVLEIIIKNIELSKTHNHVGTVQYIGFLNKKQKEELENCLTKNKLTFKHEPALSSIKVYWK